MMKRFFISFFIIIKMCCLLTAENLAIDDVLNKLNITESVKTFSADNVQTNYKNYLLTVIKQSNDEFVKKNTFGLSLELFPNKDSISLVNIKNYLKEGKCIFRYSDNEIYEYQWVETSKADFSIQYSQQKSVFRPINDLGVYLVRIFSEDYVYTIRLNSTKNIREKNEFFDNLSDLVYYKTGLKSDLNEGIEGTQGYYWKNEASAKVYYEEYIKTNKIDFSKVFSQLLHGLLELYS